MKMCWMGVGLVSLAMTWIASAQDGTGVIGNEPAAGSVVLRVATFNVEDLRASETPLKR